MNGFRAVDVATATAEELLMLDTELAELGVTSWLASIITRDLSEMTVIIGKLHACQNGLKGMKGIHIEGPFLGRSPGAHPVSHIIPVDMQWID